MKYWISTSGGVASAMSAIVAHEQGLDYEMVFADTMVEHSSLYVFIVQVQQALNKKLHWVRDGRTPFDVFIDKKFIGNSRIAPCSKILKTDQIRKFMSENAAPEDVLVLGMDWSELDRIERAQKVWAPRRIVSLLNEYKFYRTKWDAKLIEYGLDKPLLYYLGFSHNNCSGGCVRSGLKAWASLLDYLPETFAYYEAEELRAISAIGPTAKPFLSKRVAGVKQYMTLKLFRELYQAGLLKVDPFDLGGCGCFVDDDQ